jgi:hypothetical protein
MATPSVLTVPSMYGDGILYSGPSAYGSELASQPVDLQTDFVNNSGGIIVDTNTFTSSGGSLDGIRSKDTSFTLPVGTAFEIEIRGTTTSNGITLGDFGGSGNEYGSGFGVHRFVSLNNRLFIRQRNSTGTTTITHLSIRPLTQGSDFEFTRATTGTRINEEGYIEDVPYNLLSYTEQLTDGYWNKLSVTVEAQPDIIDPKNGRGAFKVTDTSGGGTSYLYVPSIADANYGRSVYARTVSGTGTVSLLSYYDNTNNLFTLTEQWQRFYVNSVTTATGQSNFYAVDFRAGDLTEVLLYAPQMTKSPDLKPYLPTTDKVNLPRLNYPVYGGCPSLLVEPQRTNSYTHSNNFTDSSWLKKDTSFGSTDVVSPDGLVNAKKLVCSDDTTNQTHYFEKTTYSGTASTTYTYSIFVKSAGSDFVQIATSSGFGARYQNFNLAEGKKASGDLSAAGYESDIVSYPNDWYRISVTATTTSGATSSRFILIPILTDAGRNPSFIGSTSKGVYIYGAQHEIGSYATSLIHTSGSTVTRNQDVAENAGLGTTDTFNDSEGVLYCEIITLNDGTVNNVVELRYNNVDNQIQFVIRDGGSVTVNSQVVFSDILQYNKIAFQYKANDFKMFANGVLVATDTAGTVPSGLNKLDFSWAGNNNFYGNVKAVAVYKTALTDTELANLTSYNNHDLFIPYRSRMQMIGADQELQCTEHDITRFL